MAKNIFKSDWFSSTIGSMIGVLAAFLLNNLWNDYQSNKRQELILKNIKKEILVNADYLKKSIVLTEDYQVLLSQFTRVYDIDQEKMITTPQEMYLLKTSSPDNVRISDSTSVGNNRYEYNGEVDVMFNVKLLDSDLKKSAWNSALVFEDLQKINIELIQKLEATYSFQKKVSNKNASLSDNYLNAILNARSNKEVLNIVFKFRSQIDLYLQFQKLLEDNYKETINAINMHK